MDWWQPPLLAAIGVAAGWLNVLAGGGSMLSVPAMVLLGLPGPVANGTNRIAIVAQNLVAVTAFLRRGYAEWRLSATLALAALPGALAGAWVGVRLEGPWFNRVLAAVLLIVMALMVARRAPAANAAPAPATRARLWLGHLLMVGAGVWGGFIQIGVGFILMPILHRVLGLDLVRVNMHKVFIVLVYSIGALAVFAGGAGVDWRAGVALAAGNAVGGWAGVRTTVTRGERMVRFVFFVVLLALVIRLLLGG